MSGSLKDVLIDSKDAVVTGMELFLQEPEFLICTTEMLFPLVEVATPFMKLVLQNEESSEVKYIKEQFQMVRDKLEEIADQIVDINKALKKKDIDSEFFKIEENLLFLFEKYLDILEASPKFKEGKKTQFIEDYEAFPAEKDLNELYDAAVGDASFGCSILDFAMDYTEKHRRALEQYFSRLLRLFYLGLIIVMGYKAITMESGEKFKKQWSEKMLRVEAKMKSLIDDCISNFPQQARIDVLKVCPLEEAGRSNSDLATLILNVLKEKYDWVRWSVHVHDPCTSWFNYWFSFWSAKEDYHLHTGKSSFTFPEFTKHNVIVSYSSGLKQLDSALIQKLVCHLESKDVNCDLTKATSFLNENMPGHVVHILRGNQKMECSHNFPADCHYNESFQMFQLCIHSE
ncbi:uncharacterized protein LOC122794187 [Protopterus annectens]|uniref:uncharacterized protein LOC122794187 n=1 Tax=Protopterus annectens TaxID=7888 RepID=UPI001CFAA37F|nr:uncharacterized protein LOC122794187 [Protopterus annectens]XP_043918335.1 uncharacterized protein LOC122794187 [Protopterus annectens]